MTYRQMWQRLAPVMGEGEAKAMARMVFETVCHLTMADLCMGRDAEQDDCLLEPLVRRMEQGEPVQYVVGQTDFCGHTFRVAPGVLIPRPETAALCQWIIGEWSGTTPPNPASVLDIGTGSGCIAVTLAKAWPRARVEAWDVSERALDMARENARLNKAGILFRQVDVLRESAGLSHTAADDSSDAQETEPRFGLIVSNPPYIGRGEARDMEHNVLDYEPHEALFVPDDDPLLFYRAIARLAARRLLPGGSLFFEINPLYAEPLGLMLRQSGFGHVELRPDPFGKPRMMKAKR